jgi:hypothetical protein
VFGSRSVRQRKQRKWLAARAERRWEAFVAEIVDDELDECGGLVRFGVGRQLRGALEELRMVQLDGEVE